MPTMVLAGRAPDISTAVPFRHRFASARASSIKRMPPLVMQWRLRKASSVRTSTSKIALPIQERRISFQHSLNNIP